MAKKYYIAYGSNLVKSEMKHRCPSAKPVGTAVLKNYELECRMYLTVTPKKNANTIVGVWEIDENDETKLDRYESYPELYSKKNIENLSVKAFDGSVMVVDAFVYTIREDAPLFPSTEEYYGRCFEGYKDFGIDTGNLVKAFRTALDSAISLIGNAFGR